MAEPEAKEDLGGQEKTYTAAEFMGLLADKQAEVKRRQEAEGRISALEKELAARQQADPHAPTPEDDPDNRPLTINDLVELLGVEPGPEGAQPPKTGGRAAEGQKSV